MKLRAIILGCGSSGGVPRLGGEDRAGDWGACDPLEPKNRRTRCSIIVQRADETLGWEAEALTTILVDTSPELRLQLLANRIDRVDEVLYTHDHADQTHGIDDLRVMAYRRRSLIPVRTNPTTSPMLQHRFGYCFESNPVSGYPAILDLKPDLVPNEATVITGPSGDIPVTPFLQEHGGVQSLGFRFGGQGGLAYSSDLNELPEASWAILEGLGCWIVDALRYTPHPSHSHVEKSLEWIRRSGARQGVLTNLHNDLDYHTLERETPENVSVAYDGMVVEVS